MKENTQKCVKSVLYGIYNGSLLSKMDTKLCDNGYSVVRTLFRRISTIFTYFFARY